MQTTYDKFPEVTVQGYDDQAWQGWESIEATLNLRASASSRTVLVVDCYPGVRLDELEQRLLPSLNATRVLNVESARRDEQALHDLLARNLTDDRVFGVLSCHHLEEFFNADKLHQLRQQVDAVTEGLIVIYGPGAALVHPGDVLVYADMPRWEIQQRMRHDGLGNWGRTTRTRTSSVAISAPFLSNGASSIATKRRCSNAPTICLIPRKKRRRRWSAAKRYAPASGKPPPVRSASPRSSIPASGAASG
jgi:hypothetical protein